MSPRERDAQPVRSADGTQGARRTGGDGLRSASSGKPKARWSADDRRKAEASQARGFAYTKAGTKPKGKAKAADKDKGKPKRKQR